MRNARVHVATQLDTRDLAEIFQETTQEIYGIGGKLGSFKRIIKGQASTSIEYYTPRDDSPFSSLDTDKATFTVGVSIPKFSSTGGGDVTLHMYVWDRGDHREVELLAPYTVGSAIASKRALDNLVTAVQSADDSLEITPQN